MGDSFSGSDFDQPNTDSSSKLLDSFPSRGIFSTTYSASSPGGMRVYICDHKTSPPEGQEIKTNQQNILIRSLTLKKPKSESSSKEAKGTTPADSSRKRPAERGLDSRNPAKRACGQTIARQEGSSSRTADKDFRSLTVEKLRLLLREKGLSIKGKKDELIARLKNETQK